MDKSFPVGGGGGGGLPGLYRRGDAGAVPPGGFEVAGVDVAAGVTIQ